MTSNILSALLYVLRWILWVIHRLLIIPAGCLFLMIIFLFCLDNVTPGRVMADEIASATRNVSAGEYRVYDCNWLKSDRERAICDRMSIRDADGYAAHFDRAWRNALLPLWSLIALMLVIASFLSRSYPVYPLLQECRYGTSPEAKRMSDNS